RRPLAWRGPLRSWQVDLERRALVEVALHRDHASVRLDRPFRDRESQTGPAGFAPPGLIHAIESVEDSRLILPRYPRAVIPDLDHDTIAVGVSHRHRNALSDGRIFHRVVDDVHQRLPQ